MCITIVHCIGMINYVICQITIFILLFHSTNTFCVVGTVVSSHVVSFVLFVSAAFTSLEERSVLGWKASSMNSQGRFVYGRGGRDIMVGGVLAGPRRFCWGKWCVHHSDGCFWRILHKHSTVLLC